MTRVGGIPAASRSYSVGQSSGGSDTLLLAIAAAVIGGTSLFGGRGGTYSALLGALVLGAIQSGMLLLSLDTSVRYMITAAVVVGAVVLDSLARAVASRADASRRLPLSASRVRGQLVTSRPPKRAHAAVKKITV
jgi:ABC-type xylose transport system permease subunit